MLHTTRGIVLRTFKHGEGSKVLKSYTEAFGARTYMVRTGKRGGAPTARLQPLDRLELVVTEHGERGMHTIREVRLDKPYVGIPSDHARGLLLLFAQEVFYRTLREESPDPALFAFVMRTLEDIDTGENVGQQPLLLLLRLAGHMGFLPEPPKPGEDLFDLREGHFFHGLTPQGFYMDQGCTKAFAELILADERGADARLTSDARKDLLGQLLTYFRLHVEGFGQLRSPEVIHAILH